MSTNSSSRGRDLRQDGRSADPQAGGADRLLRPGARGHRRRRAALSGRGAAADRRHGDGHRGAGGHRRHGGHHRLPHAVHRRADRRAGLQHPVERRDRSPHRLPGGVPQRPVHRTGDRGRGAGRDHRRRRHRADRRHAHQRGDRRARGDGHPGDHLPGVHPHRGGGRRGHPDLHRCRVDVVPGDPVRHDDRLRAVAWRLRPLLRRRSCSRRTCCGPSSRRWRWPPP